VRRLYHALGSADFGWREALSVMGAHPDWLDLNRAIVQKSLPDAASGEGHLGGTE
jgi:hypothetical protein